MISNKCCRKYLCQFFQELQKNLMPPKLLLRMEKTMVVNTRCLLDLSYLYFLETDADSSFFTSVSQSQRTTMLRIFIKNVLKVQNIYTSTTSWTASSYVILVPTFPSFMRMSHCSEVARPSAANLSGPFNSVSVSSSVYCLSLRYSWSLGFEVVTWLENKVPGYAVSNIKLQWNLELICTRLLAYMYALIEVCSMQGIGCKSKNFQQQSLPSNTHIFTVNRKHMDLCIQESGDP